MPRFDGQLEGVQLEEIASTSPTPAPRSRIYSDITNPTSAVPMFNTGTNYLPFKLGQTTSMYNAGNSGLAKTINWNNGLTQQLQLTAGCVISFTNWRGGEVHQLIVKQAPLDNPLANTTPWPYTFDLPTQSVGQTPFQPVGALSSQALGVHLWYSSGDTGETYQEWNGPIAGGTNPGTWLAGISITKTYPCYLYTGRGTTPYLDYWAVFETGNKEYVGPYSGEGNSNAAPGSVYMTDVHPAGRMMAWSSTTSPYVGLRFISASGMPNSTYSNPGTLPTGAGNGVAFSPSGAHLAVAHGTSPYVSVYPISAAGFGTKLTNPGTLPTGDAISVAWNPLGDYLAVHHNTTPFLSVYPFNATTGALGTKVANPSSLALVPYGATGKTATWRPQGDWLALASSASPYLWAAPFDRTTGTFGTPFNFGAQSPGTPAAPPTGAVRNVQFSPCGTFLLVCTLAGKILIYKWSATGPDLVNIISTGSTPPNVEINDAIWTPNGKMFTLALQVSPWMLSFNAPRNTKYQIKL